MGPSWALLNSGYISEDLVRKCNEVILKFSLIIFRDWLWIRSSPVGTGRSFPINSHSWSAKVVRRKALSLVSSPLTSFRCFLLGKKTVLALYYQIASKAKKMCEKTPYEWVIRPQNESRNSLRVSTTHRRGLVIKDQKSCERKEHWRYVNNCCINYSGRQRLPQLPIWSFCIDLTKALSSWARGCTTFHARNIVSVKSIPTWYINLSQSCLLFNDTYCVNFCPSPNRDIQVIMHINHFTTLMCS